MDLCAYRGTAAQIDPDEGGWTPHGLARCEPKRRVVLASQTEVGRA